MPAWSPIAARAIAASIGASWQPRLWKRVQRLLQVAGPRPRRKPRNKHGALLQGLLHCGRCGKPMAHLSTARGERRYRYYVCRTRDCAGESVGAAAFEASVVEQLERGARRACGEDLTGLARVVERVTYDGGNGQVSIRLRAAKEQGHG